MKYWRVDSTWQPVVRTPTWVVVFTTVFSASYSVMFVVAYFVETRILFSAFAAGIMAIGAMVSGVRGRLVGVYLDDDRILVVKYVSARELCVGDVKAIAPVPGVSGPLRLVLDGVDRALVLPVSTYWGRRREMLRVELQDAIDASRDG